MAQTGSSDAPTRHGGRPIMIGSKCGWVRSHSSCSADEALSKMRQQTDQDFENGDPMKLQEEVFLQDP